MKLSWRTELPQWIAIAAMFALAAWSWPRVPEQIPIHWNIHGEVDGYGNKFVGLLLLPLITLVIYCLFRLVHQIDPGGQNYASFPTALNVIRMSVIFMLAIIYGTAVLATFGNNVNMATISCFAAGALFIILGNFMSKIRPNWFIGVRTPWTLSSKMSWNKTNRLAGWLFMMMGLLIVALGAFQNTWLLILMLAVDAACILSIIIYSYRVYRQDPNPAGPAGISPENQTSKF
jgi:uncharacterized membrane protein